MRHSVQIVSLPNYGPKYISRVRQVTGHGRINNRQVIWINKLTHGA